MQIDGPRRRVYIKFVSAERMPSILQNINGQQEYKRDNGEVSIVKLELVGLGVRRVIVAGLPPKLKEPVLRTQCQNMATCRTFRKKSGLTIIGTIY